MLLYTEIKEMKIEYNVEGDIHYYYFDNAGNVVKEETLPYKDNAANRYVTKTKYNYIGKAEEITDGNLATKRYIYDDLGRLVQVVNALNEKTSYDYDNLGNVIKIITEKGSETRKVYDELSRIIVEIDPENRVEYISYDPAGNVETTIDKKRQQTTNVYDNRNRLILQTKEGIAIEHQYFPSGNIKAVKKGSEITEYEYYENRKLKKETIKPDNKSIQYEFDDNGNKTKMIDQFGNVTCYSYNNRNRLETVTANGKTTIYCYYLDGSRKSITYPGGTKEEYIYDGVNNLLTLINKKPDGTVINQFSYTYDKVGNQLTKKDQYGTIRYIYDSLNRVKKVYDHDGLEITYSYDGNGNILKKETTSTLGNEKNKATVVEYTYDNSNRLIQSKEKKCIKLKNLAVSPDQSKIEAGKPITFALSGTLLDGNTAPDEVINKAVWQVNSPLIELSSNKGKTTTILIQKAEWDLISNDELIIVTATVNDKTVKTYLYKYDMPLESISVTPKNIDVIADEVITFTLSGTIINGDTIPDSVLATAVWTANLLSPLISLDNLRTFS